LRKKMEHFGKKYNIFPELSHDFSQCSINVHEYVGVLLVSSNNILLLSSNTSTFINCTEKNHWNILKKCVFETNLSQKCLMIVSSV